MAYCDSILAISILVNFLSTLASSYVGCVVIHLLYENVYAERISVFSSGGTGSQFPLVLVGSVFSGADLCSSSGLLSSVAGVSFVSVFGPSHLESGLCIPHPPHHDECHPVSFFSYTAVISTSCVILFTGLSHHLNVYPSLEGLAGAVALSH
ncbi:hypothetical protein J6V86_01085 [bacterium]|nr:hypothetical protein [bacterium]